MARIYQTRNLIDPNMIQYVGNRSDKNLAYSNTQTERNANAVANMINPFGGLADMGVRAYSTRDLFDENKPDPFLKAARNEYIRTGSSSPLLNYHISKMAAEQRAADATKTLEEKKYQKELHDAVALREDRNKYSMLQANMFKAMDEGNMADAQTYKNQMEGLEQHYAKYYPEYNNPFGSTAQSMWNARSEQKRLAEEKRAQEEVDKQELELGEKNLKTIQDLNEQERLYRVEQFLSTLPTVFKTDAEKQQVYDLIKANEDMTTAEKTEVMKKIRETESGETSTNKSIQGTVAGKAGEKVGKKIDERDEKKKLADAGRAAISAGRTPTRAQQKAIDEGN